MVIEELFAKLGIDVDGAGMTRAVAAIGSLRSGMLAVGAAAAGLGVALGAMVKITADRASKINDLAASAGLSTDELQRLGYAASLSGVELEDLAGAMRFAAKSGVRNLGEEFGNVADRIRELTQKGRGAEAVALAIQKFGRNGARLVPVLRGGREELSALMEEAEALGSVLDPETVEIGDQLGDEIDKVSISLRGLAQTIATPLLSPLLDLLRAYTAWVKANRQDIARRLTAGYAALGRAIRQVAKLLSPFGALIKFLITNTWILRAAAIALAAVLLGQVGAALAAFAAGLSLANVGLVAFIANQLKASAIGLLWVATLAALLLIIEDVYGFFTGKDSLVGRWADWVDGFTASRGQEGEHWIITTLKQILAYITNVQLAWDHLRGKLLELQAFAGKFWDKVSGAAKAVGNTVATGGGILGAIGSPFSGGAATPTASVAASVNAPAPVLASSPMTVNQNFTATQPADMTGPEFAKAVADQSSENFERILGEARWGLGL